MVQPVHAAVDVPTCQWFRVESNLVNASSKDFAERSEDCIYLLFLKNMLHKNTEAQIWPEKYKDKLRTSTV